MVGAAKLFNLQLGAALAERGHDSPDAPIFFENALNIKISETGNKLRQSGSGKGQCDQQSSYRSTVRFLSPFLGASIIA